MTAQLELVRGMLPRQITLLVGGDGAPGTRPGMTVLKNLADLATWSRRLVAAAS